MSLQNLFESYNTIYENKELTSFDESRSENLRSKMVAQYGEPESRDTLRQHVTRQKYTDAAQAGQQPDLQKKGKQTVGQAMYKSHQSARAMKGEEVDFCDIIISYLIDEGYAGTIKTAIPIMMNMSEDWMFDILVTERISPADVKLARSGVLSRGADELQKAIDNVRSKRSEPTKPTRKKARLKFEIR